MPFDPKESSTSGPLARMAKGEGGFSVLKFCAHTGTSMKPVCAGGCESISLLEKKLQLKLA